MISRWHYSANSAKNTGLSSTGFLAFSLSLFLCSAAQAVPIPSADYSTLTRFKSIPKNLSAAGGKTDKKHTQENISEAGLKVQVNEELAKCLEDAENAIKARETQRALKIFSYAASRFPQDLRPQIGQARICFIEGQEDKAIRLLNLLISKYPLASQPYAMLGNIYLSHSKFEQAKQNFQNAVQLEQGDSESFLRLAQIALQFNERVEAVSYLKKSVQGDPHKLAARVLLARLLWAIGKNDEALLEYNSCVAQDPENATLLGEQASLLWMKGKPLDAMDKLNQAYRLNPESAEIQKQFITIYGARRDWPNALDAAKAWAQLEPKNPSAQIMLGWCLMMNQEFDDASAALKDAIALTPEDAEAHNIYGIILLERRRYDEALSQFNAANALNQNFLPSLLNMAAASAFKGQTADAIEQLQKLEINYPDNPAILSLHAFLACKLGRLADAERLCKETLEIDQYDQLALICKGMLYRKLGKLEESAGILQRASRMIPESALCFCEYSATLLKQDKAKQAIEYAQQALQIAPTNLDAKAALAFALAHEKNFDGAILLLKECVVRNPKDLSLRMALSRTQMGKGEVEFAESTLEKARTLFPNRAEPLIGLSEIASKARNYKQAEKLLEEALVCAPQNQKILIELARLNYIQGKPEACLTRLSTLNDAELETEDLLLKARAEYNLRDYVSAAADYDKIANLSKAGNSADILNFARALLENGQPARAQELLSKVKADPQLLRQCKQAQIDKLHSDLKQALLRTGQIK